MAIRHLLLVCAVAGTLMFAPSFSYAQSEGVVSSPLGPYASWSEADRKFETTLRSRCANTTTAEGSSRFERAREEAWKALWAACVLDGMPKDWPAREAFEAEIRDRIAAAKRADPAIDFVFREIAKRTGEAKQVDPGPSRPPRPIPSAPYASWSDAEKKSVEQSVSWRCIALATMIYAAPMKSEEAKQEGIAAFALSCWANEMPADWPSRDLVRSEAAKHVIAAKLADPNIPDSLLSGKFTPKR